MRLLRITALVSCLGTGLLAQSPVTSPDAGALLRDIARFNVSPSQTVMAVWYPFEMMAAFVKLQNPSATDEMMESSGGFMRGYAVFMVQASHKDGEGRETFLSEAEIGAIASVTDSYTRRCSCRAANTVLVELRARANEKASATDAPKRQTTAA
jgi:hypothetical protein